MGFDVSVIIPAHHEGRLAHPTMCSVFRSVAYANKKGVNAEIVIVMDKPDVKTEEYFSRYKEPGLLIKTVNFGDLGFTRNFGVGVSSGRYIAFLDADDLFGQNWVYESFKYLENNGNDIIAHPEYDVTFEAKNVIFRQTSSCSPDFKAEKLIEYNFWSALCTSKKEILLRYPYDATTFNHGFGFEDWHFNCETLAAGIEHRIVPGTVIFRRKKEIDSLLESSDRLNRIVRPTSLFEPLKFKSVMLDTASKRSDGLNDQ